MDDPQSRALNELLCEAAKRKMTPDEIRAQRVSFVYGQLMDANPGITREDVERRCAEVYGPSPEDTD